MTREEEINELKIFSGTTRIRLSANFWEALNTAIKALEQEPILDKIRAEIKHEREEAYKMFGHALGFDKIATYDKCIGIIDKYKKGVI